MQCDTVEVLILGSGPAGTVAAIAASHLGAKIMLAAPDEASLEMPAPVIETISASTLQAAERIGIVDCFAAARVGSIRIFFRDGQPASLGSKSALDMDDGWHVDRLRLDKTLRSRVVGSSVRVESVKVIRVTQSADSVECELADGRIVRCDLLIDATGRTRSPVPKQRKLLSPPLLSMSGLIDDRQAAVESAVTRFDSREWGWLWSTGDCGGYSGWTAMVAADLPCPEEIVVMKRRSRPGSLRQSVATWQVNLLRHPRILPVGDAAGSLDPASGLGLANVLATGAMTADVVQCLTEGSAIVDHAAGAYHSRRIGLVLEQADQLSRHYSASRILQRRENYAVAIADAAARAG